MPLVAFCKDGKLKLFCKIKNCNCSKKYLIMLVMIFCLLIGLTSGSLLQMEKDKNENIFSYVKSLVYDVDMKDPSSFKDVALMALSKPGTENKEVGEIFKGICRVISETVAIISPSLNTEYRNLRKASLVIIVSNDPEMVSWFHKFISLSVTIFFWDRDCYKETSISRFIIITWQSLSSLQWT